jgi:hypothetical protein
MKTTIYAQQITNRNQGVWTLRENMYRGRENFIQDELAHLPPTVMIKEANSNDFDIAQLAKTCSLDSCCLISTQ